MPSNNTVARIDPEGGVTRTTTGSGVGPTGVAVGEDAVWVANSLSGTVSRLDPRTGDVEATVEVGEAPTDVVVADGLVWVTVQQRSAPVPTDARRRRAHDAGGDPGPADPAIDTDYQRVVATCGSLYTVREDGRFGPSWPTESRSTRRTGARTRSAFGPGSGSPLPRTSA